MTDEELSLEIGKALKELNGVILKAEMAGLKVWCGGNIFGSDKNSPLSVSVTREKVFPVE